MVNLFLPWLCWQALKRKNSPINFEWDAVIVLLGWVKWILLCCRNLSYTAGCWHSASIWSQQFSLFSDQVGAKKNIGQCILQHIATFSLFWLQHFFFGRSNENTFKINDLPHHKKSIHRRAVCPMGPDDFITIWVTIKSHNTKKAKQTQNSFSLKSSTFSCLTTMVYTIYESIKYLNKVLQVQ